MEHVIIRGEYFKTDPDAAVKRVFSNLRTHGLAVLLEPTSSAARELQWQRCLHAAPRPCSVPEIWMATGGTSGSLRLVRHTLGSLEAAVRGYLARFPQCYRSLCCLPLWHVSGWMQVMRAKVAEGEWVAMDYRSLQRTGFRVPGTSKAGVSGTSRWTISLVPAQLSRLLDSPEAVTQLRGFERIFIGGAGLSAQLAARARTLSLPLAPSYGMTETAAMVTVMEPQDFLAGGGGCGQALPHVCIHASKPASGATGAIPVNADAGAKEQKRIVIDAPSLAWGYVPHDPAWQRSPFLTQDLGFIDEKQSLHITGRCNRVVNSGGEKIDASVLEQAVRNAFTGLDCWVGGVPHPRWGEQLVAVVLTAAGQRPDIADLRCWAESTQPPAWRPAHWRVIASWPLTEAGKMDVSALRSLFQPDC